MEKIEKNFGKKNSIRKNVLEKISKFSKFFFFDFFHFWPHPGVKQAENDHFWGFQSDPSTGEKVIIEKVSYRNVLSKIFLRHFSTFLAITFFLVVGSLWNSQKWSFLGCFTPRKVFVKKKKKKKFEKFSTKLKKW